MIVGGMLQRAVGNRAAILIGGSLICLTLFATYWSVNNFYTFCLTFGLILGIGVGLIYSAPLTVGMNCLFCLYSSYEVAPS